MGKLSGFSSECGPSEDPLHHKRGLLLFRLLHLARVEDEFFVRIANDQVGSLFDVDRAGPLGSFTQ